MLKIEKVRTTETGTVFSVKWPQSELFEVTIDSLEVDERDCARFIIDIEDEIKESLKNQLN